jgi:hypothetical protein
MARKRPNKKSKKVFRKKKEAKFVVVSNKGYGNKLKGVKIYYEGKKPKRLGRDGRITFGKHILETLTRKLKGKFRWILTKDIDSITLERGIYRVRTSEQTLNRMNDELWDRTRDIKNDIVSNVFSVVYPTYFGNSETAVYVPGTLSRLLSGNIIPRLSTEDRDAVNNFLPDFLSSESLDTVNILNAQAQIKTLKELANELEEALGSSYSEKRWQTYIKKNIRIIQQGYIAAFEKMNISIGKTKFPDFCLATHDGYLDILEIKKPDTSLLKFDAGRNNYYWDSEITKAVIQVENYIENVIKNADAVRSYILDEYKINLKVLRPRGIVLAGDTRKFSGQKESDDFRLLCLSTKNIVFVTYDELLSRLKNYIKVLEEHSK